MSPTFQPLISIPTTYLTTYRFETDMEAAAGGPEGDPQTVGATRRAALSLSNSAVFQPLPWRLRLRDSP